MMKLNMIIVVLFAFAFPVYAEEEGSKFTGEANKFFEFYKNMFGSVDVHTFSRYFSANSVATSRKYFRDSCGLSCRFGFNDSWKHKYTKSKKYDLYRLKQIWKILGYLIEPHGNGYVIYLKQESYSGAVSEMAYKMISTSDNSLVVDKTILLSDQRVDYKPIELVMYDELVRKCLLSIDRQSEEKVAQQAKCFI